MKTIKIIKTKEIIYKCDECGTVLDRSSDRAVEMENWYYGDGINLCGKCVLIIIKKWRGLQ